MTTKPLTNLINKQNGSFSEESENQFRLLVNGIKDYAIFMLDTQGNIISWNEGARRMKGYEEHEILTKHFSVLYSPEDIKKDKPFLSLKRAKENGIYEEEGWRVKKDKTFFWANVLITAIYKEDGTLRAFAKVTRDISAQKKVQEENKLLNEKLEEKVKDLERSEARLSAIIENAGGMVWSVDTKGRLQAFNKAFEEGYKDLKQKLPEEDEIAYDFMVGDDKEKSTEFYKQALRGEKVIYESEVTLKESKRHIRISLNPIFINNEVTGLSCFAADLTEKITARRKMENYAAQLKKTVVELEKVFTYSADIICSLDSEGRFIHVRKASEAILGYKPEELVGRKATELVSAEDISKLIKVEQEIKSGNR